MRAPCPGMLAVSLLVRTLVTRLVLVPSPLNHKEVPRLPIAGLLPYPRL